MYKNTKVIFCNLEYNINMEIYEKIVGSALLIVGLAIIGYSLISGINVFIKAQNPPEIFKPIDSAKSADSNPAQNQAKELPKNINEINPADLQKMVSGSISPEMLKSIIPPEIFSYAPRLMNYSVFSIFLWVLIIAGGKVSALGISLIKTNSVIKL